MIFRTRVLPQTWHHVIVVNERALLTPVWWSQVVRKEAARAGQQLGVGVGFIAGAERWLPPSDSVVTAKLVTQLMKQHTTADGAPLAPIVAFGLQVRTGAPFWCFLDRSPSRCSLALAHVEAQGPEEGFPPEHFEEAFTIARAAGLCSVPHAGAFAEGSRQKALWWRLGARG